MSQIQHPFFSIIIPTYNRPEQLALCLQSLAYQDYPTDYFEVIVVDDGGKAPLSELVSSFRDQLNIILLTQQNKGPATARNTGAAQAKGQFLAFTDDDCQPDANWLKNLAACFKEKPDTVIGGKILNNLPKNIYSTASQLLIDYLYHYYNFEHKQAHFLTTNNFALPKKSFHAINGFDTHFPLAAAEDRDFCHRWLSHGYKMLYVSEAIVYHHHCLGLLSFWRQQLNYGKGAFIFHHTRCSANTHKKEPLSFYWRLIKYPFSKVTWLKAGMLTILMLISQIAIVTGYFGENINSVNKKGTGFYE